MQKLFSSGTNKKVTGKAADSGYTAAKSTTTTPRVQLPAQQTTTQNFGTIVPGDICRMKQIGRKKSPKPLTPEELPD